MEHTMTIQYETVKYYSGNLNDHITNPGPDSLAKVFADPAHYDTVKSPLARGGSTGSVLGPGGIVDGAQTIAGAIADPSLKNILGAIQAGGNINDLLRDPNLRSIIRDEGNQVFKDIIRNQGPGATQAIINKADSVLFPKASGSNNPNAGTTNTPRAVDESATGPQTGSPTSDPGVWT